jgi:hypothetical protein
MSEDIATKISWTSNLEDYFCSTGEKAHCQAWLHKHSEAKYSRLRTAIDLPVIVLSSLNGFLLSGSEQMFGQSSMTNVILGILSLFIAVLSTTQTYFSWAKRAEGHRISSIQFSRLYRFLHIELSLPRDERIAPGDLLKMTKDTYDRLQEISPLIPPDVLHLFKQRFDKEKEISKPEETNGLEKIVVYKENPLRNGTASSPYPFREQTPRQTPIQIEIPPSQTSSDLHDSG